MASKIPHNFLESGETAVATYNWSDIASGTGYSTFYGQDTEDGSLVLGVSTQYSLSGATIKQCENSMAKRQENNFDVTFNLPRYVKGELLVGITYSLLSNTADTTVYVKVRIYHVDVDGTETEIGTQQTGGSINKADGTVYRRTNFSFDVDKKFKKDETLRLNIELWGEGGVNSTCTIYHDGANRDFGGTLDIGSAVTAPSNLQVDIPFRIDL